MMAQCKTPFIAKNPSFKGNPNAMQHIKVPCGKCSVCLTNKSRQWIFRLKEELKVSSSAFFITYTYEDEHLPWSDSGIPTLCKPDFQNYMKRLRKSHSKRLSIPIRYFMCGEYGKSTRRPHYHALVFNSDMDLVEKYWDLGFTYIGKVSPDSIAYCTKYIMKENADWQDQYKNDPSFIREYSTQSKGIGKAYFENHQVKKYHKNDLEQNFITDEQGYRYSIPRYYKDKIFTDDERAKLSEHGRVQLKKIEEEEIKRILEAETKGEQPYQQKVDQDRYSEYIFQKRLKQKQSKL